MSRYARQKTDEQRLRDRERWDAHKFPGGRAEPFVMPPVTARAKCSPEAPCSPECWPAYREGVAAPRPKSYPDGTRILVASGSGVDHALALATAMMLLGCRR